MLKILNDCNINQNYVIKKQKTSYVLKQRMTSENSTLISKYYFTMNSG